MWKSAGRQISWNWKGDEVCLERCEEVVPHGSIFGQLLLKILRSDFVHHLYHCNYSLYADDLQVILPSYPSCLSDTVDLINQELQNIWISNWVAILYQTRPKLICFEGLTLIFIVFKYYLTIPLLIGLMKSRILDCQHLSILVEILIYI